MEHAVDKIVKIFKKKAPKDGDAARSAKLLSFAAAHGSADAQLTLGRRFISGEGVDADHTRGSSLLAAAAAHSDAFSASACSCLHCSNRDKAAFAPA